MADTEKEFKINITGDATGVTQAAGQAAGALEGVGNKGVKAEKDIAEETKKATLKFEDKRAAIEGLRTQFPLLAEAVHLALHPIGMAIAGIAGAFAIWSERVKTLDELFGGMTLPDVSTDLTGHVNAAAKAWDSYAEAIRKAGEAYNSVDAAADRYAQKLTKQAEQQKALLESQKALDVARLEASKGEMGAGEYEIARKGIEDRYAKAGIAADEQLGKQQLNEKARRAANLTEAAERRMREAAGIRVASSEDDAATLASFKANAEAAQRDIKERRERLGKYVDQMGGDATVKSNFFVKMHQLYTGLSPAELADLERQGIASDQQIVDAYSNRLKQNPTRDAARKHRDELTTDAAKETAEARNLQQQLPGDISDFNQATGIKHQIAANQGVARNLDAQRQLAEELKQAHQKQAEMQRQLIQAAESLKQIPGTVGEQFKEIQVAIERLNSQLTRLRYGQ